MEDFRDVSQGFHKSLSKTVRQSNGIFFTPKIARDRVFALLDAHGISPRSILEPSFGSGEFLYDLYTKYPTATVHGVELNAEMFASVPSSPTLVHMNFLEYTSSPVDLIVGNPPYFTVKDKDPNCMTGRGNIYIQFLYKCLTQHLATNGILAFVLPTSLYNSSYYEPCRRYIAETTTILAVETLSVKYYETTQQTMILLLQKKVSKRKPYIFERGTNVYITPYSKELKALVKGSSTLRELGYTIKTGEVVWNQEKDKLSDSGTLLIYTTNIVDNALVLHNLGPLKQQYITGFKKEPTKGPALLVSRGYGNSYRFSHALIREGEFYGENHINVISPTTPSAHALIDRIADSFKNKKTLQFITYFVGNGALSKTELETILPIFVD